MRGTPELTNFLDKAIEAHTQWKIRLLAAVNGGEPPDRATATSDACCDLGRWIHADGAAQHGGRREFVELRESHRLFHVAVGAPLDLVARGKKAEAKANILSGEFHARSSAVVAAIGAMRRVGA